MDQLAHGLFWPDADARDVLVLGSETCPHSRAVAARLRALGVPFREVDTRRDPIASALAAWAYQSLRVPVVVVGPEVIHGNRADRIDQALARGRFDLAILRLDPQFVLDLRWPAVDTSAGWIQQGEELVSLPSAVSQLLEWHAARQRLDRTRSVSWSGTDHVLVDQGGWKYDLESADVSDA